MAAKPGKVKVTLLKRRILKKTKPDAVMAENGPVVPKSSPRRLHYNRVYHATRLRLENDGMEPAAAKLQAIAAAHASCEAVGLPKQVSVDEW